MFIHPNFINNVAVTGLNIIIKINYVAANVSVGLGTMNATFRFAKEWHG